MSRQHHIARSATRIEERERRVYKDAHAAQFTKIRHFPALSQVTSNGGNVILLQDNVKPPIEKINSRMDRIHSRVHAPDAFESILGPKSMLNEFRSAVLCKHSNAREAAAREDEEDKEPTKPTFQRPPRPIFNTGNPQEAKSLIARPCEYDYPTGLHSHESRVILPLQEEINAQNKILHEKATWVSTNSTRAKKAIEVDYYMNSPLPNSTPMNRKYVKEVIRMAVSGNNQISPRK